jgi:hypothetical protein
MLEMSTNTPEEEFKRAIDFMRRTPATRENLKEMRAKFALTRPKRIQMVKKKTNTASQILQRFPRLCDMFEAVFCFNLHFYPSFSNVLIIK